MVISHQMVSSVCLYHTICVGIHVEFSVYVFAIFVNSSAHCFLIIFSLLMNVGVVIISLRRWRKPIYFPRHEENDISNPMSFPIEIKQLEEHWCPSYRFEMDESRPEQKPKPKPKPKKKKKPKKKVSNDKRPKVTSIAQAA